MDIRDRRFDLLILLVLVDVIFILLHIIYKLGVLTDPHYSIEMDWGFAEVYQYIKQVWIVVLLIGLRLRVRVGVYFAWALLFSYLLLDDSCQIHENLGDYLAVTLQIPEVFSLGADDIGELIVSLTAGVTLLSCVAFFHLRSPSVDRGRSWVLFFLLSFVAFFGVFIDMAHMAIPWFHGIFGLIEDAGEMLGFSAIVCYGYYLNGDAAQTAVDFD